MDVLLATAGSYYNIAEGGQDRRARRTVWMTLVDYWVVPGAEPTAPRRRGSAPPRKRLAAEPAPAMTEADPVVERDRAAGGHNGLAPDVAVVPRALGAGAVVGMTSSVRDNA